MSIIRKPLSIIVTWFSKLSATTIFLVFAGVAGAGFTIITPPFQGWDETEHFYRAYQISELNLHADRVVAPNVSQAIESSAPGYGGYLPKSLITSVQDLRFNHDDKGRYIYSSIFSPDNQTHYDEKQAIRFDNTAIYSPAGYLPQAFAIAIARVFDASPVTMLYLARIAGFAAWAFVIYWAIRLLPRGKRLYVVLALNPVAIFLATTLSPDAFAAAFIALSLAIVLRLRAQPGNSRSGLYVGLLIGCLLLGILVKNVYLPIIFLVCLIPRVILKASYKIIVLIALIGAALFWNISILHITSTIPDYFTITEHINAKDQLLFMVQHPLQAAGIGLWNVFGTNSIILNFSYNGTLVENKLPDWTIAVWWIVFAYATLTVTSVKEKTIKIYDRVGRFLPGIIAASVVVLIVVSMYVGWTPVGSRDILGVQGRYFIPVSFLFVPLLMSNRFKILRFKPTIHATMFIVLGIALFTIIISLLVRYTIGISGK